MSLNDTLLFILSLIFLGFYYVMFNSDIFIESVLSHYSNLTQMNTEGKHSLKFMGNLVIMILLVIFYAVTYLLIINLV